MERYGTLVSSQNDTVRRKIVESSVETFLSRYGVRHPMQDKRVLAAAQATFAERYGAKSYLQSLDFERFCTSAYGCRNPMQCREIMMKHRRRYTYDGIGFDSAPEVAFYVWLSDVKDILGLDFQYSPDVRLAYEFDGKTHFYAPDFSVCGQLFELKGDHFFDCAGRMRNPFRNKDWTDERYSAECARYEAKQDCMSRNGVIVLRSRDYGFFVRYVSETYGADFICGCRERAGS